MKKILTLINRNSNNFLFNLCQLSTRIIALGFVASFPLISNDALSSTIWSEIEKKDTLIASISPANTAWDSHYLSISYDECKQRAVETANLLLGNVKTFGSGTTFGVVASSSTVSASIVCFGSADTTAYTLDTGNCSWDCPGECDSVTIYKKIVNIMQNGI